MLTADELREAIKTRLTQKDDRANDFYINHNDGVIRGLVWALTGVDQGSYPTTDIAELLTLAGIKFEKHGDLVTWD